MTEEAHHGLALQTCRPSDHIRLKQWFKELATYEGRPAAVTITAERLQHLLETKAFDASFISSDSQTIGYAVTFPQSSTFSGQTSLYIEDIFVAPEHRGKGIGRAVMRLLGRRAESIGATTLSWSVLRTNREAIGFYEKLGATPLLAWGHYAIDLKNL